MNRTILSVNTLTNDDKIRKYTDILIENRSRKFKVVFTKKDGSVRSMVFVPKHEYNDTFGLTSTDIGRKIVGTKVNCGMIVVNEILREGEIQPSTVNLNTVISLEVL